MEVGLEHAARAPAAGAAPRGSGGAAGPASRPADDRRRAVGAGLELDRPLARERPSWRIANRAAARTPSPDRVANGTPRIRTSPSPRVRSADRLAASSCRTAFMSASSAAAPRCRPARTTSLDRRVDDDERSRPVPAACRRADAEDPVDRDRRRRRRRRAPNRRGDHRACSWWRRPSSHSCTTVTRRPPSRRARRRRRPAGDRPIARVGEHGRGEPEPDRVERRRLDAVVGCEPAHDDVRDAVRSRRSDSSSVGVVSPVIGSRIVNPE
jgi:hypothetical protein